MIQSPHSRINPSLSLQLLFYKGKLPNTTGGLIPDQIEMTRFDYSAVKTPEGGESIPLVVALVACHQGQTKEGVDHSWMTLLSDPRLCKATFVDFRDTRKFDRCPVQGSVILSRNIDLALKASMEEHQSNVPLLCLGGDHTVSIGTFIATRKQAPNTRLVWIDAHPDINTPCGSLSGNCHGMPVAHLFNYVKGFKTEHPLQPHEIVYIGLRSIDAEEQIRLDYLKSQGACIYSAEDVVSRGISEILMEVDASWKDNLVSDGSERFDFPIHVSLDVDSMDPAFTPATGTPVPGGIAPTDVMAVLKWCHKRAAGGLTHLDIVEINCYLGTPSEAVTTVCTANDILQEWLSGFHVQQELPLPQSTKCANAHLGGRKHSSTADNLMNALPAVYTSNPASSNQDPAGVVEASDNSTSSAGTVDSDTGSYKKVRLA